MTKYPSLGPMLPYKAALALSVALIVHPAFGQLPWMNTTLSAGTYGAVAPSDDPGPEDPADSKFSDS